MCNDEEMKEPVFLEYYNTLVMEDGSDPHFTLGHEYVLHETPESEDGPVFLFNDLGEQHYFDKPGYRDLMGFSIDDYFRVKQ